MKLKRIFFALVALLAFVDAKAQIEPISSQGMILIPIESSNLEKVEGSEYFNGEEFAPGSLKIDERELSVFLRYNVAEERMEIRVNKEDEEIYQLKAKENTKYSFGDNNFYLDNINHDGSSISGYFIDYFEGEKISLVGKPIAEFTEAEKAKTGYGSDKPARIDIKENYYFIFKDGSVEEVRTKKRDLRRAFDSEEVNDFLKGKRIRSVEDLVSVARFYDENSQ